MERIKKLLAENAQNRVNAGYSRQDVSDIISASCFYVPVNGQIFTAISALIAADQTADPITLRAYFEKRRDFLPGR